MRFIEDRAHLARPAFSWPLILLQLLGEIDFEIERIARLSLPSTEPSDVQRKGKKLKQ